MSLSRAFIAVLLLAFASPALTQQSGIDDLVTEPDPQIDRPGSQGPGQGELEMEREFGLAGIAIPWGEDRDVPADRAVGKRDGLCVFRYRYAVRNTDRRLSLSTSNRIRIGAADGALLHSVRLPGLPAGGHGISAGEIALPSGRSVLYVQLDAGDRMIERDEKNNLRRIGVNVHGECGQPRRLRR